MEINYKKIRPEQIVEVFEKNNVYFDRDIRIAALRKALLTKYETEKKELEEKISSYDIAIKNLKGQINVIKRETKAKLDSVDRFGDDELERFFAERYRQLYDSIKQTNSETGN